MTITDYDAVAAAFDADELIDICQREQLTFDEFGEKWEQLKDGKKYDPEHFYFFKDNGSTILATAHLDNVCKDRTTSVMDMHLGPLVYSGALDDRLGAYVILKLLPKLGITVDWLLTTNEEIGQSTAKIFVPPEKTYNWMFSFDRKGTDVVMYDYETTEYRDMIEEYNVKVARGSFSDICCLKNLGCMGVNWGVGYRDYHGPLGHAFLQETFEMVANFVAFYNDHHETHFPYVEKKWTPIPPRSTGSPSYGRWGSDGWREYDYSDGYYSNRAREMREESERKEKERREKKAKRGRGRGHRPVTIYADGNWELDAEDDDSEQSIIARAWQDWKDSHPITIEDVNDAYYLKMCPVCEITLDDHYTCVSCGLSPHEWGEESKEREKKKAVNEQKLGDLLSITEHGLTPLNDDTPQTTTTDTEEKTA